MPEAFDRVETSGRSESPIPKLREGVEISQRLRFVLRSKHGTFELSEGESLVGRSRSCQVVVKDPSVSRSHALLTLREGALTVKDLSSSNGTYINGKRVQGQTDLAAGDRLTLGETHLDLEGVSGEEPEEEDFSFAGLIAEVEAAEDGVAAVVDPALETLQAPKDPAPVSPAPEPPKPRSPEPSSSDLVAPQEAQAEGGGDAPDSSSAYDTGVGVIEAEIIFEKLAESPDESPAGLPDLPPPPDLPVPEVSLPEPMEKKAPPPFPAPPSPGPPAPSAPKPVAANRVMDSTLGSDTVQEALRRLAKDDAVGGEPPASAPPKPKAPMPSVRPADEADSGEILPSLDDLDELLSGPGPASTSSSPAVGVPPPSPGEEIPDPAAPGRSLAELDRVPRGAKRKIQAAPVGLGLRISAGLLDLIFVGALAFLASLAGGGPWQAEGGAIFYTALFGVALLVQVFGLNLWGTTPGKRMLGLHVFDEGGAATLSVGKALARFGGYLLSGLSLGFGFLMILFTPSRRGLHDVLAGTYVGRKK